MPADWRFPPKRGRSGLATLGGLRLDQCTHVLIREIRKAVSFLERINHLVPDAGVETLRDREIGLGRIEFGLDAANLALHHQARRGGRIIGCVRVGQYVAERRNIAERRFGPREMSIGECGGI